MQLKLMLKTLPNCNDLRVLCFPNYIKKFFVVIKETWILGTFAIVI